MAKPIIFVVLASALFFSCFVSSAYGEDEEGSAGPAGGSGNAGGSEQLIIHGSVYCDTCNIQFVTKVSQPMPGATVRLECKDVDNPSNITLNQEATTDENGGYKFTVDDDHAEESCEVGLVKSSKDDCAEIDTSMPKPPAAKISITNNNGIIESQVRIASALGFMKKEPLPECPEVLKELGLTPDGTPLDD